MNYHGLDRNLTERSIILRLIILSSIYDESLPSNGINNSSRKNGEILGIYPNKSANIKRFIKIKMIQCKTL